MFSTIASWTGRISASLALILGLLFWIFQIDLVDLHMGLGILTTLALLIESAFILFVVPRARLLGGIGILYAIGLAIFGMTQMRLLVGDLHWIIQALHLLVGIGAMIFLSRLHKGYQEQKKQASEAVVA